MTNTTIATIDQTTEQQDDQEINEVDDLTVDSVDQELAELMRKKEEKKKVTFQSRLSFKGVFYSLSALAVIGASIAAYVNATKAPDEGIDLNAPRTFDEKVYFASTNPIAMVRDIQGRVALDQYKAELAKQIIEFDAKIKDSFTENEQAALRYEANRLMDNAITEAKSGKIENTAFAQSVFDLANFPQQSGQAYKGVLMRNATEAITTIIEGDKEKDIYKIVKGQARFNAAMIALSGNIELKDFSYYPVAQGMQEQIRALRELNTIAPVQQLPIVKNVTSGAKPANVQNPDLVQTTQVGNHDE